MLCPASMGPNLLNTVKDLDRLRQIVGVLAKHGFGQLVARTGLGALVSKKRKEEECARSVGERIRLALQELGPSFVKLGQIVSTRPDIIPPDIITELKKLQDEVPPEPFEKIKPMIESELGAPLSELFVAFEETPLASASIGQVHRAKLKTEEGLVEVVVSPPMLGETTLLPRKRALRTQLEPATLFQAVHIATLLNPEQSA